MQVMTTMSKTSTDYRNWLSAPERKFIGYVSQRQQAHRTAVIMSLEKRYGPGGMGLLSASILSGLTGSIIGILGVVTILVSSADVPAYFCIIVGVILELLSITRAFQGTRSAKRFRAGRSFTKS
jgi:hypothetical protein